MKLKLTKEELEQYIILSQKPKTKTLGIRLSSDELKRYNELADKHGKPLSSIVREVLYKILFLEKKSNSIHF